jgi:Cu2+-exporting ATPase
MSNKCFHCFEPVPKGISLSVNINNISQPMCCIGCQSIAQTIVDNNLVQYYQVRTEPAQKGQELVPEQLKKNKLLDEPVLQNEFIYQTDQFKEAILTIDGISCAACAWLIEMKISKLDGVKQIEVNATSQRATIRWQDEQLKLSEIITAIDRIGYQALPFKANDIEAINKRQSKTYIKRLGISGILMMQVMMIAFGLYFGAFSDMSQASKVYMRWVSFLLTLPIVTYGAFPFYLGAFNALKLKKLSMDVPVSIAISLAFMASGWATVTQQGEVYFESVSMFTFLLLIGKFLEFRARSRAALVSANLLKLMPMTATKISPEKSPNSSGINEEFIAAKLLESGDKIMIKPGEIVPADGVITAGLSQLNESMLSGEQLPITKSVDEQVYAGTINGDGNIEVRVKHPISESFLSQLIRLSESAQSHKPKLARLSDKIAQYFVAVILITAIATALYWHQHLPEEAFWITLSVLVATCPCALSLATPTALTCATTHLNRDGIMIKSAHVLETLPQINAIAFDKTGTLTTGDFEFERIEVINTDYTKNQVLTIASALESRSEHPIAKPFMAYRDHTVSMTDIVVHSGKGVSGCHIINNEKINFSIGKPSWLVNTLPNFVQDSDRKLEQENDTYLNSNKAFELHANATCLLIANNELVATFYLKDRIREEALLVIDSLNQHCKTFMLSGDNQIACDRVSNTLPMTKSMGSLSAEDKMNILKKLQQEQSLNIAMVGDGVNDSPVFGAAHVSIAMGSGADIAKVGADIILLGNNLQSINTLIKVSLKTRRIILQNYLWAFGYNAIVLPLAVMGFITPYMAVIGMSLSSILVITNSLRLLKK